MLVTNFLFHHLWESTVLAALLLGAARWIPGLPTRLRAGLLTVAAAKFLIPTSLLAFLAVRLDVAAALVRGVERLEQGLPASLVPWLPSAVSGPEAWVGPPVWGLAALAVLWLGGVGISALRWRRGHRRVAALVAAGREVTDGEVHRVLGRLTRRFDFRRPVRSVASPDVTEPAVWGVRRPVLLLPADLPEHLSGRELEAVLLHELVHVARRDNLAATAYRALCCLFWFHPLVWRLAARLRGERERLVDERVLALGSESRVYARGLLKVLRLGLGLPSVGEATGGPVGHGVTAAVTGGSLGTRVQRILAPAERSWPRPVQALALAATLTLVLGLTLVPLPRAVCPTLWAAGPHAETPEAVTVPVHAPVTRPPCSEADRRDLLPV